MVSIWFNTMDISYLGISSWLSPSRLAGGVYRPELGPYCPDLATYPLTQLLS